ncbi:high-affinity zinc uptake system ATP-binding protein ZnuC [Buchnera aphidicola str. Bp (Baizongia pistaciae)]|uniref:Zinc import ATP-binding protein ZnuC n=1 Tax=Buchnera aphidicola subsp. Baizongia pistaciae (strain Bp) TaxID=224915 RepID=ZNUC_BUCBP|nr:zinc ABC transporter ATP-binding protein ZnuC [Buchnera aphidicola]Q89AJ0.1 RecName: Full=Zinc import ATP-binding protein ZnuC [Buchnera aphidicola str. Bp (Baizongia pistaciae)]AAO27020.1 high-affinity zinc uptake system ATP-binding protein ZnuC [Buchnera aphidicola str. Bp (Baizongia pistaciae)]
MSIFIQLNNISVNFNNRSILSNISLALTPNCILTLIGPNGAGKSTLVRVILGLLKPNQGKIFFKNNLRIGYIPQKLNLHSTLPITVNRFMNLSYFNDKNYIQGMLSRINIIHLKHHPLQKLSGGEMQKVLLARALLKKPELLVLDEPTQGIDIIGKIAFYKLVNQIKNELKCSILMVSHDLSIVMANTDKVICLNNHICCSGPPETISKNSEFIAIFGNIGKNYLALYRHRHNHHHDF